MKLAFLFIDFLYLQSDFICNLYMMVISTLLFLFLCPFRTNGNLSLLWVLKDMPLKYYSSHPILLLKNKPDVFKTYVCKASCSFSTMVNRGQEAESLLKRIYKVIREWLLPALDLKVNGKDNAVSRGWLPPVVGLGWPSKRTSVPQSLGCPQESSAGRAFG